MIKAENVTVLFKRSVLRKLKALDNFSLKVNEGDVFALLGPNGAGKSTAMYCFLGLIQPDAGEISINGKKPFPGAPMFKDVAYLPEEPHYHLYLTVEEAVSYYAALYDAGITRQRVREAIEQVGLSEFRDLKLSACSKGMKQKAGIAQCLVANPKVVFLDEPTRGLDPVTVKEFRDILKDMNKKGVTIVLNSHVLSEIEMIASRVAIMKNGRVVAQDDMNNLRSVNPDVYAVEFGMTENVPPYVDVKLKTSSSVKGEIHKEKLQEFMQFSVSEHVVVYECSLKKNTLEDSFVHILEEAR